VVDPTRGPRERRAGLLATTRGRRLLFAALYFSEGAPVGYVWWALPTRLREADVPIEAVTALSATLTLPWAFKFLWAPLVDSLRSRRLDLRAWIIGAQLAMGLTLIPVAEIPLAEGYDLLLGLLLVHAICAATQDVAVDALAVATTPADERGSMSAFMQLGMLLGRAAFGGLALALERRIGAANVIYLLVGAVWSSTLLVAFGAGQGTGLGAGGGGDPAGGEGPLGALAERLRRFRASLLGMARRRETWLGFALACLAGAGMEATGTVAGPMLVDHGFERETIGRFFALPAVSCMALGAIVGGHLSDRARRDRALATAIVLLAAAVGCVGLTASMIEGPDAILLAALALAYLCYGGFTAASYALYMDLTHPALGGTQFSAFMGAVNLCSVWSAFVVGRLVADFGYPAALPTMAALSLLSLPLLAVLRGSRTDSRSC
jgi:MFS family permease